QWTGLRNLGEGNRDVLELLRSGIVSLGESRDAFWRKSASRDVLKRDVEMCFIVQAHTCLRMVSLLKGRGERSEVLHRGATDSNDYGTNRKASKNTHSGSLSVVTTLVHPPNVLAFRCERT
ncbi:MAG: hypothetical protein ACREMU_03090, partial [Gemmatimonadaceae bacterium]